MDTDAFLDFIDANLDSGADYTKLNLPFEVANMTNPHLSVCHEPEKLDGSSEPWCSDFVLSSEDHLIDRGYKLYIGTEHNPTFMPVVFRSAGGAGTKRGTGRINWDEFGR